MLEPGALPIEGSPILAVSQDAHVYFVFFEFVGELKQFIAIILLAILFPSADFFVAIVVGDEPDSIDNIGGDSLQKQFNFFGWAEAFAGNKSKVCLQACILHIDQGTGNNWRNSSGGRIFTPCCKRKATPQNALHSADSRHELAGEDTNRAASESQEDGDQGKLNQYLHKLYANRLFIKDIFTLSKQSHISRNHSSQQTGQQFNMHPLQTAYPDFLNSSNTYALKTHLGPVLHAYLHFSSPFQTFFHELQKFIIASKEYFIWEARRMRNIQFQELPLRPNSNKRGQKMSRFCISYLLSLYQIQSHLQVFSNCFRWANFVIQLYRYWLEMSQIKIVWQSLFQRMSDQLELRVGAQGYQDAKQEDKASTKFSEGSAQVDEDEELRKQGKYEYINEKVQDWPQWSVEQKQPEEQTEDVFKLFYNRGLDSALRSKLMTNIKEVAKVVNDIKKNVSQQEQKGFDMKKEINKRMKGWRNW